MAGRTQHVRPRLLKASDASEKTKVGRAIDHDQATITTDDASRDHMAQCAPPDDRPGIARLGESSARQNTTRSETIATQKADAERAPFFWFFFLFAKALSPPFPPPASALPRPPLSPSVSPFTRSQVAPLPATSPLPLPFLSPLVFCLPLSCPPFSPLHPLLFFPPSFPCAAPPSLPPPPFLSP